MFKWHFEREREDLFFSESAQAVVAGEVFPQKHSTGKYVSEMPH